MNKFMLNITASSGEYYQGDCEDLVLPISDGVYGIQAGHSPVLVAIHMGILHFEVNGESRDILVRLQGNGPFGHTANLAAQSAVDQPLNGQFKVLGPRPFPQDAVNEFLILLCKLRGDAVPHHTDAGNDGRRSMLGKVLLVV